MAQIQQKLNFAIACQERGDLDAAEAQYREILRGDPEQPAALHLLGVVMQMRGLPQVAVPLLEHAARRDRKSPYIAASLGEAYQALHEIEKAIQAYRQATKLKPDFAEAHANLSNVLRMQGKLKEARASIERALRLRQPTDVEFTNLGMIALAEGRREEAEKHLLEALCLNPESAEALNRLGQLRYAAGEHEGALVAFEQLSRLHPDDASALVNVGNARRSLGLLHQAADAYLAAQRIEPENAAIYWNLGVVDLDKGELKQAIDLFRRAIALDGNSVGASRYLMATLLYEPDIGLDDLYAEHLAFARRHVDETIKAAEFQREQVCRPHKLRVGYVSSDFRQHPVARNLSSLIEAHDRAQFEIFAYGNVEKPDEITQWFEQNCDGWRSILGLSDQAAAARIREDKIDILVILAGRFDANRPLVAAYRAAPVQVSFHDPATSGLREMDYLITDITLSPRNTRERFTERLVRLPTFYLHDPISGAPELTPLPVQNIGHITFGSFNSPTKINEQVVALWAKVLHAVPNSRLVLKYLNFFSNPEIADRYRRLFVAQGIDPERVDLIGERESPREHMRRYAQIDIALDPFPFTGSTTTFEALYMGVPVVTLPGQTMVSRWSAAMLRKAGLPELIASSEDDYVAIARSLAQDTAHLAELRRALRARVERSPLCDVRARARQLERLYRWMWRKWCAEHDFANQEQAK
jgi:predicted O-linked N-acetylglucosamine transferase (SPINDLY family)